jgi:uncharacterized repeat protein (TIGR03806 family)
MRQRWVRTCRRSARLASAILLLCACGTDTTLLTPELADPIVLPPEDDAGVVADAATWDAGPLDAGPPPRRPPNPFRLAEGLAQLPARLELSADWRLVEAFPGVSFDDPVALIEAPGTGQLLVAEREGRLYAFERRTGVTEKRLMLDLSSQNQGENDSGLLGIACHPEFARAGSENARYLYAHYAFRASPIVGRTPPVFTATRSRLSRFTVDLDTMLVDPASELVLIDQEDESVWHQGGALFFHPGDGFLYLSVGDEGGGDCQLRNCQRINRDLFSGVLRIDVDRRGGDVSHAIVRQPQSGTTQAYFIPNDNPFVGQPGVLEEFYAIGLRNAYRMTHDPVDDLVWLGEVGQEGREELNLLAPGANYQWNVYEGTLQGPGTEPAVVIGNWTAPLLELDRRQALTIIGGYVYRGQRLPALQGKYVFADFSRGRIWALPYELDAGQVQLGELQLLMTAEFRNRENGITSFGVDLANELYVLTLGKSSKIQRLESAGTPSNAPTLLSDVGVFTDLPNLKPAASLVAYSVQSPLWSDGADKQRWVALPAHETVDFTPSGPWHFPVGTVFVKHFSMALDERRPAELKRLETRLLVAAADAGFYGLTYRWNAQGDDAELVADAQFEELQVIGADGSTRAQTYFYPGPRDCLTCHNAAAGHVLGVRTAQLNGPFAGPHPTDDEAATNQLAGWVSRGSFGAVPNLDALDEYPRLSALTDETQSLEQRVRSYWDANCSMCHGVQSSLRAEWDARYRTPLAEQGVLWGTALNGGRDGAVHLIEPGFPERSIMYQRNATLLSGQRMPPLASNRRDEAYLRVLERWIVSLAEAAP